MKDPNDPDGEQFLEEFDQLYSGYRRKRVLGTELAIADVPYMEGRITSATEAYIHVMVTDAERDPPQDGILFPAAHLLILRRPSNTQAAWTPVDSVELTFTEGIVQGDATIIYYTTCILEDAGDYVFRITPNSNTTRLRFTAGVWWMGFFI